MGDNIWKRVGESARDSFKTQLSHIWRNKIGKNSFSDGFGVHNSCLAIYAHLLYFNIHYGNILWYSGSGFSLSSVFIQWTSLMIRTLSYILWLDFSCKMKVNPRIKDYDPVKASLFNSFTTVSAILLLMNSVFNVMVYTTRNKNFKGTCFFICLQQFHLRLL